MRLFGLLLLSFAVTACVSTGPQFDMAKVNAFQTGITTEADAIAVLGPPSSRSSMSDGTELLQWIGIMGTPIGGKANHAAILFGRDNKMIRITHQFQQ